MIVKTKKYQLEHGTYKKLALENVIRSWWWAFLLPLAMCAIFGFFPKQIWIPITAFVITALYIAFWWIQFSGVIYMEQSKMLFEKLSYQIDSRQILVMLNSKQGMPITWEQLQTAKVGKDAFLFIVSKAQLIYLPYKVFNSPNEIKFIESILKRKNLIK